MIVEGAVRLVKANVTPQVKTDKSLIEAFCRICEQERILISGWQYTDWAAGPMEPVSIDAPLAGH